MHHVKITQIKQTRTGWLTQILKQAENKTTSLINSWILFPTFNYTHCSRKRGRSSSSYNLTRSECDLLRYKLGASVMKQRQHKAVVCVTFKSLGVDNVIGSSNWMVYNQTGPFSCSLTWTLGRETL